MSGLSTDSLLSSVYDAQPENSKSSVKQQLLASQLGHIEVITGPMFSGKSTALLARVRREQQKGRRVVVMKSKVDNRYSLDSVVTHSGDSELCRAVQNLMSYKKDMIAEYSACQVLAIDEAQFFPDLVEFCTEAAERDNKIVYVSGLDGDYLRRRFGQVLELIPLANSVTKLSAKCAFCTDDAHFTLRIAADCRQEVVGGADKYRPVCRFHYLDLHKVRSGSTLDESTAME